MRTEKVSLTLDKGLVAEARKVVGARKLSSYVNRALRLQLQHDRSAGSNEGILNECSGSESS